MGIKSFFSRRIVIFGLLFILILLIVYTGNFFVDNQRYNLYCQRLTWGMDKSEVKELLANIGPLNWREFNIEGTKVEKVQLSFKNKLLDFRYGGVMILYFHNNGYYSALLPAPVGEEKGLCKKPE